MNQYYNFKNIRLLLTEGFVKDQLLDLCFDTPDLREIYENMSDVSRKSDLIRNLIDYAHKQVVLDQVLAWAKRTNRVQYDRFEPYYQVENLEDVNMNVGQVLLDNSLGRGITLGGAYRDIPLQLMATKWIEYGQLGWVRSGWLFIPQWTANHATTFFKVHANRDGKGYIHLTDVSAPAHVIWLTTTAGSKEEKEFHYILHPSDVWQFSWKE